MFRLPARFSTRVIVGTLAASLTTAAAVAGTMHTFAVSQTTGSEGAYDFLQTTVGGALQGEVGSAASTGLGTPFGIFGKYGPSSTDTKGLGVVGISSLGWGVTGENIGGGPALYAFPNSKDGVGLDAESDNQEAIYAQAHGGGDGADLNAAGSGYGLYAFSAGGNGADAEGESGDGIDGYSDNNSNGVYGYSGGGYGVQGNSATSDGVHAEISNAASGVAGINDGSGNGVYGKSVNGPGVKAYSVAAPSPAPTGGTFEYAGTYSQSSSGPGLYGVDIHANGPVGFGTSYNRYTGVSGYSTDGAGIYGYSSGDFGMIAESGGALPTLVVEHDATSSVGDEILAGSGGTGNGGEKGFNYAVESNGNEYVGGSVTSNYGTFAITRNPRSDAVTYGAESTQPMVEDVGIAHLVNGAAAVAIDGAFRQTIQETSRYMVFLTPEGDSNGLYITQKSPAGFVVREARGGRSTMDFDYKIVAQRYGVETGRLPHLAALSPRMDQLRFAALHPSTGTSNANTALRYPIVAPPVKEGSRRAELLAQARFASAAEHRRRMRPPAPPPGFLAGLQQR